MQLNTKSSQLPALHLCLAAFSLGLDCAGPPSLPLQGLKDEESKGKKAAKRQENAARMRIDPGHKTRLKQVGTGCGWWARKPCWLCPQRKVGGHPSCGP